MALPQYQNDEQKSVVKEVAKQQALKQGKKLAKKLGKVIAKHALGAVKALVAALFKAFLALLGSVGLPAILIVVGVVFIVILVSQVTSFMFSTGEGLEGEELKKHEFIVEQANSTVNMNSPIEKEFRVPHELISAVIQLDIMEGKDYKEVTEEMATALKPVFEYNKFNEWTETKTKVCRDGDCGNWSKVERKDNMVSKIVSADYWNGHTYWNYEAYITDWVETVDIKYETVEYEEEVKYTDYVTEKYVEYETQAEYVTELVPYTTYEYKIIDLGFMRTFKLVPVTKYKTERKLVEKEVPVTKEREVPVSKTKTVKKTKQVEVITYTRTRHQKFSVNKQETEDYNKFDTILSSYEFGINDKRLVEANFLLAGGTSNYLNWLETNYGGTVFGGSTGGFNGTVIPGDSVPAEFMAYYLKGEQEFGVHWYVLAAIHFVETGFSTHPTMISSAGAIGPMQFMPATWVGWDYNIGDGLVSSSVDITSVALITKGRGYGTDGDGDGKADPWNEADAIVSAAKLLASNGYAEDPKGAIFKYNKAHWYVDKVLKNAEKFKAEATYLPDDENMPPITSGDFMRPTTGNVTSLYGMRDGRMHHGIDIGKNGRSGNVPVVAAADGVVVRSYHSDTYGHCVIIRHDINGQQYETLYAHLENRAVSDGQNVQKGQFLGNMGNTGRSFGAHLHFEIHKGSWNSSKSNSVNPLLYVPK